MLARVESLLSSMQVCELRSKVCLLTGSHSAHWPDALSGIDRPRFDAFIEHRNVNMARRAIELSAEGPVAMLVGAAHVPSFEVDGRIVPGINELLRRAGFRGTPILRCGDQLCPESSVGTPSAAGADSAPPVPTPTTGPAPSPGR